MRVPRGVRNAAVSSAILLVLFVAGGVVYVLLADQGGAKETPKTTAPAAAADDQPIKPVKPSPDAKEGAAVEMITSPVAPGSNVAIDVRTNPGSACTISVVYAGVASTDSGLGPKTAGDFGTVSWSWTVGASVPLGVWPVKVTCVYHGRSAVVDSSFQVIAAS